MTRKFQLGTRVTHTHRHEHPRSHVVMSDVIQVYFIAYHKVRETEVLRASECPERVDVTQVYAYILFVSTDTLYLLLKRHFRSYQLC